jgi:hypothetical protein
VRRACWTVDAARAYRLSCRPSWAGMAVARWSQTSSADRHHLGRSNERSGPPGSAWTACRPGSGPRPAALPGQRARRLRGGREGRPEADAARERHDAAQHVRAHVARRRRVHPRRRCRSAGGAGGLEIPTSCGLIANYPWSAGNKAQVKRHLTLRCRSRARTRAGADGTGVGPPR